MKRKKEGRRTDSGGGAVAAAAQHVHDALDVEGGAAQ